MTAKEFLKTKGYDIDNEEMMDLEALSIEDVFNYLQEFAKMVFNNTAEEARDFCSDDVRIELEEELNIIKNKYDL